MAEAGVESEALPRRPFGAHRLLTLASIVAAGVWAAFHLGLDLRDLIPGEGGLRLARELFSRAFSPALTYESADLPAGIQPLPLKALDAAWMTVKLAAAALSLSLVVGLGLGFAAARVTWRLSESGGAAILSAKSLDNAPECDSDHGEPAGPPTKRGIGFLVYAATRLLIALMRSIHELLWAVLLLGAFGLSPLAAVIAIAIPYAGTLAKVFSEMLDEAPRDAALALRTSGASPAQVFLFGLLPRALPDMCAYAFYRFECALRSSAVLGFFGYPTLGFFIAASFENLHYGEVWTYLYTLILLVILADLWSGALRRRLVK